MRCLILLLLFGSAFAQPVRGPFEVWQEDSAYVIRSLSTVEHNDTLELLWSAFDFAQERSIVHRAAFSMSDQEIAIPCTTLGLRSDWYWTVYRPRMTGAGVWRAGLSGGDIQYYPDHHWSGSHFYLGGVGSELLTVRERNVHLQRFHENNWPYMGCSGQEFLSNLRTCQLASGRICLAAVVNSCYDFGWGSEPQFYVRVYEVSADNDSVRTNTTLYAMPTPLYGPTSCRVTQLGNDSLAIISGGGLGNTGEFAVTVFYNDTTYSSAALSCELPNQEHLEIGSASDNSLLILSNASVFQANLSGDCDALGQHNGVSSSCDPFFHPNYGFAAIQALPGYLLLARIDTSGNEVQPVGVLYETDGTSFIVDADVTISDSGEVIAVWSEYTDWNEGPHVLKIAWTDWTTYLDTPEQQAPAIPRQISLSSYPNPFNSTVTIKYDLPIASRVTLSIFDIHGRLVETILNDFTPSGSHTQVWSPTKLASGVYFARLNAELIQSTTKLLYLK
jgi:hypothetical protein